MRRIFCLLWLMTTFGGCAAFRIADYAMPAIRLDRPHNVPVPEANDPVVKTAIARWESLAPQERTRFPTPYHVYVQSPAPGSFEGKHTAGLAFSGGGTRGTLFGAACLKALDEMGPIHTRGPGVQDRFDVLEEIDYVSGVSTGAIPAALFVLNRGSNAPKAFQFEHWPACFNVDFSRYALSRLAMRPDWLLRDFLLDVNTRPMCSAAFAALYFDGHAFRPASGLTFADLPPEPILLLGATIIDDPSTMFLQTRMPYRFAVQQKRTIPWRPGTQSFESFNTDPMPYPLGEAVYNALSYPGLNRSGLLEVLEDPGWIVRESPGQLRSRMADSRGNPGYSGTYEIKDGGMTDNRGIKAIGDLFESLVDDCGPSNRPLLLSVDAGYLDLRAPEAGGSFVQKGWFQEFAAATTAAWQTGQNAVNENIELHAKKRGYSLVRFRYAAWVPYALPESAEQRESPERRYLERLCAEEKLIQTPAKLLETARTIGTSLGALRPNEYAAVMIAARFAVWNARDELLAWASGGDNAEAYFEASAESGRVSADSRR